MKAIDQRLFDAMNTKYQGGLAVKEAIAAGADVNVVNVDGEGIVNKFIDYLKSPEKFEQGKIEALIASGI